MSEPTYTLAQLAEMTMLTDRTLRNYLKAGLLQGEKTPAGWRFRSDQIKAFFQEPFIRQTLEQKEASVAEDFLLRRVDTADQLCTIWDHPADSEQEVARICDLVLRAVNAREGVIMSYSYRHSMIRITLRGSTNTVLEILALLHASPATA